MKLPIYQIQLKNIFLAGSLPKSTTNMFVKEKN